MLKSKHVKSVISLALAAMALGAQAETNIDATPYVGASLGLVTYEEDIGIAGTYKTDHTIYGLRGGAKFNQHFSAEFRFGRASEEGEELTLSNTVYNTTTEIERYVGAYLRGHIPVNESVSLYGLIGMTKGKFAYSITELGNPFNSFYGSETETDTSFGFGAEFFTNHTDKQNFGLGIEYMQYIDKNDVIVSGMTLSALVAF